MKGNKLADDDTAADSETVAGADTPDVSSYEAKIAELTATLADRDVEIQTATAALNAAKAANYDLLMAVSNTAEETPTNDVETDTNDGSPDVDVDDLFEDGK